MAPSVLSTEVRPIHVVVLLGLIGIVAGGSLFIVRRHDRIAREEAAREVRRTPVILVAPAALAEGATPLAGPTGTDADGWPRQYVDPVVVRGFLMRGRYDDLDKAFEAYEDAAEKDYRYESWIVDAANTFRSADPALDDELDAWVKASPSSFAPWLARGMHWGRTGFTNRGTGWVKDTPKSDLEAMHASFTKAEDDLAHALSIRPKSIPAKVEQMAIASADGSPRRDIQRIEGEATSACPGCMAPRVAYMQDAEPRWGGSFFEMELYAKNATTSPNPKAKLLAGYVNVEHSRVAAEAKDWATATAEAEKACALGDLGDFFEHRAHVHTFQGQWPEARADFDRAIALEPRNPEYLAERADVLYRLKEYEAAGVDLLATLRIDPAQRDARPIYDAVISGLIYQGAEEAKAGHDAVALRIFDLANELAPSNADVHQRRAWLLAGGAKANEGVAAAAASASAITANPASVPDDFDSVRRLDYTLSRQRRFAEILPLWDAYLAKHPDDGRAYLERGGTHVQLGQRDLAGKDARKACDLGVNEGCLRAKQLGM